MPKPVECDPTGNFRVRRNWFGKLILQIECKAAHHVGLQGQFDIRTYWRDANESDLFIHRGVSNRFKVD
jgi:hypothetical protein